MTNTVRAGETDLQEVVPAFFREAVLQSASPLPGGLIHATFRVVLLCQGSEKQYVFQRLHPTLFSDPSEVMDNIMRITAHLRDKAPHSQQLSLVLSSDQRPFWTDPRGNHWRVFGYIPNNIAYESVSTTGLARQAGRAFGRFLSDLQDFKIESLKETLPRFHHTPARYDALQAAWAENRAGRAEPGAAEMSFLRAREDQYDRIETRRQNGLLPTRVTHNDPKISNVLFEKKTDRVLCVIDLDTVMPGSMLYDFGDLVRTTLSGQEGKLVPEDPQDTKARLALFEALAKGYLSETAHFLTRGEKELLVFSARLITLELAMRFLTDYLEGDVYFQTSFADENLQRTRQQLALVSFLETHEKEMEDIVARIFQAI